jgi:hypothetical protein
MNHWRPNPERGCNTSLKGPEYDYVPNELAPRVTLCPTLMTYVAQFRVTYFLSVMPSALYTG